MSSTSHERGLRRGSPCGLGAMQATVTSSSWLQVPPAAWLQSEKPSNVQCCKREEHEGDNRRCLLAFCLVRCEAMA